MPGTIIVKPIQAKLDKEEGALTKFDPYCVAIVGDRHAESEVCKKGGKNPVWHDALALKRADEPYCYLEVKSKSLIKDKMLGICAIDLDELAQQGNTQKWYELYYDKKHAGDILIEARMAEGDGYPGGNESARALSPDRPITGEYRSFAGSHEGLSTHHSSSKKDAFMRQEEPIVGHSPFSHKIFEAPESGMSGSGIERTSYSLYRDSPIEPQNYEARIYDSQSTVKDLVSALDTREFSTTSYNNNMGFGSYPVEYQEKTEVERELSDLQTKVDLLLCKSKALEEERLLKESLIFCETPMIQMQMQSFQRQDSIPSEGTIKEEVPTMPNPQHMPIHASHDKFGSDSNAVSRAAEFRAKLLERVSWSKNMIKQRIDRMVAKDQQEFNEHSQPSIKHKMITGIGKAMAKRQFNSERKVYNRERSDEREDTSKGSNLKQKVLGGAEQITRSSINALSRLEGKLREQRGEEEKIWEEKNKSRSAKKEGLKEKVEYIKDISREKVLARLRREGVDEGVQTEEAYLEEPGKETIMEKVEHIKEIAKEKIDEMRHKKKGHEEVESSEDEVEVVEEEENEGIIDKIKGGIAKGAKHVAIKMAKKKVEKAEEHDELSHPKKKVHRKAHHENDSGSEESFSPEEHIPKRKRAVHHEKHHHHKAHHEVRYVKRKEGTSEEEEGVVDKIKNGIEKNAKHMALKMAEKRIQLTEENLEHPKNSKKAHKKTVYVRETSSSPEEEEGPGKIEMIKEKITGGVEKVKEAVMERKAQTEVKKSKRKSFDMGPQEHEEGNLKRKFMEEIEQIMSFAKEKIAQFGNKETEEHETDQRVYDELTRSAERTFAYDEISRDRADSLNSELIEGMRDLTATLDRLQQRIESRIGSCYSYDQYAGSGMTNVSESYEMKSEPGMVETIKQKVQEGVEQVKNLAHINKEDINRQEGFYYEETDIMIPLQDNTEKPGMVETIKEKVREGVEEVKNMVNKDQETEAPSGPIAELMDNLSKEIQECDIDDKIYMTKEYKEELNEEEHLKAEKLDSMKQKVKEGIEQVRNLAHVTNEDINKPKGFYYGETDIMIPLQDNTEKPGMVETIKEKVREGVEQVKSMVPKNQEETEVPSGPIADLMDQLSEEISKPKEESVTEFEAEENKAGAVENIKHIVREGVEQVKHLAHKEKDNDQEAQMYSGMGVDLLFSDSNRTNEMPEESPASTIFKYDYANDETTSELKSTGIVGAIKQKIKEGIHQVKELVSKDEVQEVPEEDELTSSEVFKPQNELPRSPQLKSGLAESIYFLSEKAEETMTSSDIFKPKHELKRSPDNSIEVRQPEMFESVYFTAPKVEDNTSQPVSFGGATTNYQFEENRAFGRPIENIMYESQYTSQIKTPFDEDYEVKQTNAADQQGAGNKENAKPFNYFTAAYADLTNNFRSEW